MRHMSGFLDDHLLERRIGLLLLVAMKMEETASSLSEKPLLPVLAPKTYGSMSLSPKPARARSYAALALAISCCATALTLKPGNDASSARLSAFAWRMGSCRAWAAALATLQCLRRLLPRVSPKPLRGTRCGVPRLTRRASQQPFSVPGHMWSLGQSALCLHEPSHSSLMSAWSSITMPSSSSSAPMASSMPPNSSSSSSSSSSFSL
mmetsp:Transcript_11297/g.36026  ORF Transcript_11297/g.36026 Transcript_11297/m.36026 type:complete len:207 (-) Transcript_11297:38-658(-)